MKEVNLYVFGYGNSDKPIGGHSITLISGSYTKDIVKTRKSCYNSDRQTLEGVIEGLAALKGNLKDYSVVVYTSSNYVVDNSFNLAMWDNNFWTEIDGSTVCNMDLWSSILYYSERLNLKFMLNVDKDKIQICKDNLIKDLKSKIKGSIDL